MMTIKERVDRHDREIAAIRKLILQGMKMLNQNEQQLKLLTAEVRALVAGMRKGGNGNGKYRE
jgi:hypothetical protein